MTAGASRPRSRALRISLAIAAGLMFAGFFALGTWQVFRLQWKLALIERVEQRVHAAPVDAPGVALWPQLNAEADDYRRVRLSGHYLKGSDTQVLASLDRGIGYWVLSPMCTADGAIVMVNRGFIRAGSGGWAPQAAPPAAAANACAAGGEVVTVSGLLRLGEVSGRLRQNEPARNYWYTRDVQAIAHARGLPAVAPYFVDADAGAAVAEGEPLGGLTVVSFANNHLVYAVTWYALALMIVGGAVWVVRDGRKSQTKA
ncbi:MULTISPECIES: SURF1 family protein [unclassified Duganella]|uniref:SURF1 family protein n=1 Tax=unclassified Duganella TaxID=2636909 RepID=UPI000E34E986|nr:MULTISPECIES: SURF1 family protein [unclassified Duganella]RFP19368.1 SURF1 family protein [Duganella sp. BJB475]RFP35949.1 SURF1 family protein [Duganella sp. BJB476]